MLIEVQRIADNEEFIASIFEYLISFIDSNRQRIVYSLNKDEIIKNDGNGMNQSIEDHYLKSLKDFNLVKFVASMAKFTDN